MMMLLPLWPKESNRFPVIATFLVALNLAVFLVTWPQQNEPHPAGRDDLVAAAQKMASVLLDPDSGIEPADRASLEKKWPLPEFPSEESMKIFDKIQSNNLLVNDRLRYQWDLLYPVFNSMRVTATANPGPQRPFQKWGFNPERPWFPALATYTFLHDGWIHLLFNMLFLWIAATIAEEILGIHMIWFYLAGGVASALAQAQMGIPSDQILVGASGAIAALLGLDLIARPAVKVKLFYFVLLIVIPKYGLFDCPLWFFLPVWFVIQLLMSQMAAHDAVMGTAYAAHIGGFVFGCLVGALAKSTKA